MTTETDDAPQGGTQGQYVDDEFIRDTRYMTRRILDDPEADWPVQADRYRLVAARACPWANRMVILRRLLGLEDVISLGMAGPVHDEDSWTFDLDPDGLDPVLGIPRLKDAYLKAHPDYPLGITVPALVDVPTGQVVTNDFAQMELDLNSQWRAHTRDGAPDMYPEQLRDEIDKASERIYTEINNGVYRCGFARTQKSYDDAIERLVTAMQWAEERLSTRRYLVGDHITQADVRLWVTLVRFDVVYHGHFKCNRTKLSEMPALWAYARDLFQTPGFGDTVDFPQIAEHYYIVHRDVNPSGVVPVGPDQTLWAQPHDRDQLPGTPWADGATAPGPVRDGEAVPHEHNKALALLDM